MSKTHTTTPSFRAVAQAGIYPDPVGRPEESAYGFSADFSGGSEVAAGFAGGASTFEEFVFPTVRYLRILSRRFSPRPRIASKSSTLLKGPYDLRICKIFCAVAGPIPGTS